MSANPDSHRAGQEDRSRTRANTNRSLALAFGDLVDQYDAGRPRLSAGHVRRITKRCRSEPPDPPLPWTDTWLSPGHEPRADPRRAEECDRFPVQSTDPQRPDRPSDANRFIRYSRPYAEDAQSPGRARPVRFAGTHRVAGLCPCYRSGYPFHRIPARDRSAR